MAAKQTYFKPGREPRRGRGFAQMSGLIKAPVKTAGERRGFAVMRLLTHWEEIVGPDLAQITSPVKMGYARDGFGATLTILASGANAPMVQMQLPQIRERVNACYGYAAISRVAITQTAPVGFHEGRARFEPAPEATVEPVADEIKKASAELADGTQDEGLKLAIDTLAQNFLQRQSAKKGN
ncbi:MAG: DciA family protein [Pseudomonadota bacterium]